MFWWRAVIDASLAVHAWSLGLAPVPVRADGSKAPLVMWRSVNEHGGPSREQVEEWFATPQLGWGLLCGDASGGLELFEVEARAMADGTFERWQEANDRSAIDELVGRIADGYCEASPSGGWHLLYRVPGAVRPNTRMAATEDGEPLFESRGQGGFVVVAPSSGSTHPTGKPWRLVRGGLDSIVTITPAERDALWDSARRFDRRPRVEAQPAEKLWQPISPHQWMDAVIAGHNATHTWADVLRGWTEHHTDAAGITYWTRPGKDPREGWSATTNANGTDRLIVFTSADVGGFDAYDGTGAPTSYDRFGAWATLAHGGDRVAATRALRSAQSAPVAPVAPPGDEPEQPSPLDGLIDWVAFWARDRTTADWLYEPILARGRSHAIFARHKVGKSRIALWLAAQLATGDEAVPILYLDYEMTEDDLYERLEDMGYGPHSDLDRLGYALLPSLPNLDTAEGGVKLLELVEAFDARVVIIDTMSRAVGGGENDSDTFRSFYEHTGLELKRRGVTYARLDHAGKDPTAGQRGSSAKGDDVDVVWEVTGFDGGLRLRRHAVRMGWVPAEVKLFESDTGFRIEAERWPDGTADLAQRMFLLGVDFDGSISAAQDKLRVAGEPKRRSLVAAAVKYQRARSSSQIRGTASGNCFGPDELL